jgi:hypothetical protein
MFRQAAWLKLVRGAAPSICWDRIFAILVVDGGQKPHPRICQQILLL